MKRLFDRPMLVLLLVAIPVSAALAATSYRHIWRGRQCGHTHETVSSVPQGGKDGSCPQCGKTQSYELVSREEIKSKD